MNVLRGRDQRAPLDLRADAVVVGSGSGGAVVARELARAGLFVVVVEEGAHHTPAQYGSYSPSTSLAKLMRESGLSLAFGFGETPTMSVLAGKCVGGSSVVTGGVCFRIPDEVRHEWQHGLGLSDLSAEALAPLYEELERDLSVEVVPDAMRSRSTELFVMGAEKLGIPMKSLRRNMMGCKGASRCNFGCPNQAKRSVDVVMLPEVTERAGIIVSDALVERVIIREGRAVGVKGHFAPSDDGRPGESFEVHAPIVVVACGSLHTPLLLRQSGLHSPHIGRHLTLHPSFRVGALFDEDVNGWDGAMQSVYSDHYASRGITLIGAYTAPSILSAAFPGVGRAHRARVRTIPKLAFFGALIHDEPSGRIRRFFSREPFITYSMAERDRARMWESIGILGEMAFAAGARELLLPVFGAEPLTSREELRAFLASPPSARRVESMSFHPLGTARMAASKDAGVVAETGETFEVKSLFVADGSVLPSSLGVNSQLPVMTMALHIARQIVARTLARAPSKRVA